MIKQKNNSQYTAIQNTGNPAGNKIIVSASDLSGNLTGAEACLYPVNGSRAKAERKQSEGRTKNNRRTVEENRRMNEENRKN